MPTARAPAAAVGRRPLCRKDYVDAFWNVVDWRAVEERYLAAKAAAGCTSDKQEL